MDILWYRDDRDGLNDREYVYGRPQGRLRSLNYTKYTIFRSQLFISPTFPKVSQIRAIYVVHYALLPIVHRSKQFVCYIIARYPFISSYSLPTHLEPEWSILMKSFWMLHKVGCSVDDGLSAFLLHRFATWWSSALRDGPRGGDLPSLQASIICFWRYTLSLKSSKIADACGGSDCTNLEGGIVRVWRFSLGDLYGANLEALFEQVWRCTSRLWLSDAGHMHLEAMIVLTRRL